MKIQSRSDQYTFIYLRQTKVTSIPLPNLTNTSLLFNTLINQYNLSIDVSFYSQNFDNVIRYATLCSKKSLESFDQSQLFEMNGTYSKVLDLSSNRFQELPKINQLDVHELNLKSNNIMRLIDSTNLSTSIEVNRAYNNKNIIILPLF